MSIFKENDVVYHPIHGKLTVVNQDNSAHSHWRVSRRECEPAIQCDERNLSFKPWPAPCHERPFEPVLQKDDVVVALSDLTNSLSLLIVVKETSTHVVTKEGEWNKKLFIFKRIGEQIKFN